MDSSLPIRVLVRHVDALTQAGITAALSACEDFEVLRQRSRDDAAAADVVVADFDGGLDHLRAARLADRPCRVLVVTTSDRERDIRHALRQGVRGYVLQGCSLDELAGAVRQTFSGHVHLGTPVAQRLAESLYGHALTRREEDVLAHVVEGLCNKEIARRLELSVGTVKSHLRAVYAKLEVTSRTQAAAEAGRRGLLRSAGPCVPVASRPMPRQNRLPASCAATAAA